MHNKIKETVHFYHNAFGVVINPNAVIGNHCKIQHSVTIGEKTMNKGDAPIIEDEVFIGARAVIIGKIIVGHHSIIGAGAVVTKDVLPYSVVAGNPAQVIGQNK